MIWNDVKARAAANPSAVLAISAGIAWRLLKDPPVATALIGAGVLGLWRARPIIVAGDDYFATAKRRFQEQVDDAMGTVSDYTAEASAAAQEKIKGYMQVAGETVDGLASSAAESGTDAIKNLHAAAAGVSENTVGAARRGTSHLAQIFNDGQSRDHLLLGAAGLAVAAALGLAYQRRISDESD